MAVTTMAEEQDQKAEIQKIFPIKASQGVAVDKDYFYAISNTKIVSYDKHSGKEIASWKADKKSLALKHFKHMNSGSVIDGKLYCAHSRFPSEPNDSTIEIWNIDAGKLTHSDTIKMPKNHGSLTWADKDKEGFWWMCYAVYGKEKNKNTKLVKYEFKDKAFVELKTWTFPDEAVAKWGRMSCSGGSWGPDGLLYTTGHDHKEAYVLKVDQNDKLIYMHMIKGVGFYGQAIAWDRFSEKPLLWGIIKNKQISMNYIQGK